jgi:amino acid transporter/mannitol/fructose-specific phosphotransferase system IIA component (Ntr-type)
MLKESQKLKKELKLFDVYAIATGAMFSSGFFLLPGLAAVQTGPSVFLAYLISGIIVLPTMFSVAELAPALPRAGGTYYIIDRALGPLIGTVGGYGSWLALILKSAFALIGMGAYLALFWDVNITAIAVILTVSFGIINIIGAKETALFQRILVSAIVVVMVFYIVQGVAEIFSLGLFDLSTERFSPFLENGVRGLFATVGMVFVSYAGLTKVASVAEEVENPDRNIPLGMFLSIATAIVVYTVGVFIMTVMLDPSSFRADLTPVATAGQQFLDFLPGPAGLIIVTIAAVAAFASTGNAGILSASRYPFAMARDKLIASRFGILGKRGTPTYSIMWTVLIMIFILLVFNVSEVAKLASAFELLLFALLNLAVIVMRESRIEGYDPAFKCPLYPWMPIAGMISSVYLIYEIGFISIFFTLVVSVFAVGWYYYYVYDKIDREGAIFHIHERLGKRKDQGLEREMRGILREKGLREEDPYEAVVSRAAVIDVEETECSFEQIIRKACSHLALNVGVEEAHLYQAFTSKRDMGAISIGNGVALNHIRLNDDVLPEMVLVRIKKGIVVDRENFESLSWEDGQITKRLFAIYFLVSPERHAGQHLRFLAHLAEMVDHPKFLQRWLEMEDEAKLREMLLRDERFINLKIRRDNKTGEMIGKKIMEIDLPGESLIAILKREGEIKIPHGNTVIQEGDELSIIGEVADIEAIQCLTRTSE